MSVENRKLQKQNIKASFHIAPPTSLPWVEGICLELLLLSPPSPVHALTAQPQVYIHTERDQEGTPFHLLGSTCCFSLWVALSLKVVGSGCQFACQEVFSSSHSQLPCSQPRHGNSYWGWRTICRLPMSWTEGGQLPLTSTSTQLTTSFRSSSTNGRWAGPGQPLLVLRQLLSHLSFFFFFLLLLIFLFCLPLPLKFFFLIVVIHKIYHFNHF